MGTTNPFFHRGPIHDTAYFYNRQYETSQVLALLANGQSISIVAPRRMGKTSLLLHVIHPDVYTRYGLTPERYCFVYLDCQGWRHLKLDELYPLLLEETREALATAGHADVLPSLPSPPINYLTFRQTIQGIARRSIQLIFLLDEFETLSSNSNVDADFFSGLRGLATRYRVAYITASTKPLLALTFAQATALSSPFFNIFAQVRLPLFALAEAQAMLVGLAASVGLAFTQGMLDFLFDLAGTHPFFLQIAAYYAVDVMASTGHPLDEASRDQVCRLFLAEAEAHWTYAWQKTLEPEDQKALALLPITARSEPAAVRRLEDAGLVRQHGGEVVPLSPAFQAFVAQQEAPGLWQAPPLTLEPIQRMAFHRGQVLKLSPPEFDLLALLMQHKGEVLSAGKIMAALWPGERLVDNSERLKDVLKSVRRVLGADAACIHNVRGQGYAFRQLV